MTYLQTARSDDTRYYAPRPARQDWQPGSTVDVGFMRGLGVIQRNSDGSYALWEPTQDRYYRSRPHAGLSRVGGYHEAVAASVEG